jgi:HD-GYP domain-containing protein (c-di-GMP phosphodiesterase class II)
MQILVIEEKQELLDLITMNLKMNDSIEVIPKLSIREGKAFVDLLPELKLIIINNSTQYDDRLALIDYVLKEKDNIEMIVVSSTIKTEHPRLMLIDRIEDPMKLMKLVKKKFAEDFLTQEDAAYSPVTIDNLKYFKELPCDVYIKRKDGDAVKFVKLIKTGDTLPEDFIQKYSGKKVEEMYISKGQKDEFTKEIAKLFLDFFKRKSETKEMTFENFEDIHKQAYEQMNDLGFSQISTKLAMESVSDLMTELEGRKDFKGMLNHVYKTDAPYSYRFSYMTSLVGHALVKSFTWSSESNLQTIMYAAMFADLGLSDAELKIRNEECFNKSKLDRSAKEALSKHAYTNGNRLKKVKGIPEDVAKTIIQHHGAHNGIGYPHNISSQVTNLALCLIVSQEFVHYILGGDNKINVSNAIDHIKENYSSPKLEGVLSKLKKCVVK